MFAKRGGCFLSVNTEVCLTPCSHFIIDILKQPDVNHMEFMFKTACVCICVCVCVSVSTLPVWTFDSSQVPPHSEDSPSSTAGERERERDRKTDRQTDRQRFNTSVSMKEQCYFLHSAFGVRAQLEPGFNPRSLFGLCVFTGMCQNIPSYFFMLIPIWVSANPGVGVVTEESCLSYGPD